jgi:Domain of unknown function (DUF4404)
MDPDLLREQLAKLHEELGHLSRVDPRSNELMVEVLQDIQRLLEQQRALNAPAARSLPERLEQIAVQFEVDHPTLAASSRRLIDLLGKAGL